MGHSLNDGKPGGGKLKCPHCKSGTGVMVTKAVAKDRRTVVTSYRCPVCRRLWTIEEE